MADLELPICRCGHDSVRHYHSMWDDDTFCMAIGCNCEEFTLAERTPESQNK